VGFGESVAEDVYVPKRDEVTGNLRTLHGGERHHLYVSPNMGVSKLWSMRWTRRVARVEERRKK
jgi:hypothetical protein